MTTSGVAGSGLSAHSWTIFDGRPLRRALLVGVHGAVVGLLMFGLSRVGGGLLGAGAFLSALFMIPVTAGAVIAVVLEAWQESPREPGRPGRPILPSRARTIVGAHHRCTLCRRRMPQVGYVWVCPGCDGVTVEH